MSWADLPVDILFVIFRSLLDINNHKFLDLYQCLAVCRSWRFAAKQIWRNHILPTAPWLLFHLDMSYKIVLNTNLYKFHNYRSLDTIDNGPSFLCTLDLFDLTIYASYDGWLLLGDSHNRPFLYNPITGVLLQLPPLPSNHILSYHTKFVSSGASPTDHNCIVCIMFSNRRGEMGYRNTFLAFCRPVSSSSWIILQEKAEDIIFNRGKFYTVTSGGALYVYNENIFNGNTSVCMSTPWKERKLAEAVFDTESLSWFDDRCFFYLVESKQGELLMIKRTVESKNYSTASFSIFKLNWSDSRYSRNCYYYWEAISSLPEKESIILLWNEGTSILVDGDDNGYKSNCIYFYDEAKCAGKITTYGIYDLEDWIIIYKYRDEPCYYSKLFTPSKLSNI